MTQGHDGHAERAAIDRAFVAFRYTLGARRSLLLKGLFNPSPEACQLANALSHNERTRRALALAEGLKSIVEALNMVLLEWH